ncbi:MAG: SEC-C domain-containing protein [Spirochaetaceae bacterium]|nr:SEC-C domain-containing protein [Spirochaetaceae bacterium]
MSRQQFRNGRRALRRHRNRKALQLLTAAVAECPASERSELAAALRALGFACARLGRRDAALRCWVDAQRTRKQARLARLIRRCSNDYGMPRQHHRILDDWRAFHSLQLSRYVAGGGRLPLGPAESDMLRDLLWGHFTELLRGGVLEGLTTEQRRDLFMNLTIPFPLLRLPSGPPGNTIAVDFMRGRRPSAADPCVCGSALPYAVCCGRVPASEEVAIGS